MVDAESYGMQERELQRRLPHVPLEVIKHFLAQYQGNLDECYHRLRTHTPVASPNMEPFFHNFGQDFGRTSTISTSRPTDYQQEASHYQHRPPQDHRTAKRLLTWGSGSSQTLPIRSRHHQQYTLETPSYGHRASNTGYQLERHPYDLAYGAGPRYHVQQPRFTFTSPPPREVVPSDHSGVIAVSRINAQRQQLEAIHKYQERQARHLSGLKQEVDQRQHRLSRLRIEVSGLTTEQQVSELKEVIQTLEIDLNEARRGLHMYEMQSQMKEEEDLYTDEGPRWYCKECSFLNHPLMTLCEKCDIPKLRSHS